MKSILKFPISKVLYNFGLMLLVFTICRLAFFLSNYNYFSDLNIGEILNIFAGGLKFDISALLYFKYIPDVPTNYNIPVDFNIEAVNVADPLPPPNINWVGIGLESVALYPK